MERGAARSTGAVLKKHRGFLLRGSNNQNAPRNLWFNLCKINDEEFFDPAMDT